MCSILMAIPKSCNDRIRQSMNVLCLVVDRLQAAYLGCYGNAWIETPAFDHLASESFVFDQAVLDSPHLELLANSFWRGTHPLGQAADCPSLPQLLRQRGLDTALITDDAALAGHPLA